MASGESSVRPSWVRARANARGRDLVGDLQQHHRVERLADGGEHLVERLGLGERAREAVEHESRPTAARRSRISPTMRSSGTRSPRSRIGANMSPSSDPLAIASRRMSPVATCGTPYAAAICFA